MTTTKFNFLKCFFIVMLTSFCSYSEARENEMLFEEKVYSPDKNYELTVSQKANALGEKILIYQVNYKGKPIVLESELAMKIDNHLVEAALAKKQERLDNWFENLELINIETKTVDTVWHPVYGEKSTIRDHYNEITFKFQKPELTEYKVNLVFQVYNEGVAFRYHFPENPSNLYYHIVEENSTFTLPENTKAWFAYHAQSKYQLKPLEEWSDEAERPLTLELENGLHVALTEAAMVNYARTKFKLSEEKENTLVTSVYGAIDLISPFNTPWRVIMAAETPGELIENNHLILNLNEPGKLDNTDWIKPGKIVRDVTLTDEGAKAWIDFAAEHNIQYVLFDWKWYGPAFSFKSDAGTVAIDLDLQGIIDYGKEKGVGIWVYVNQQALLKQDAEIFPLYKKWGVAGVKYGFVQVGSHRWTTWLHESIQRAAENQLMVNIHDEFRLTGEERTWPNILTVEGIRGNEEMPDATHNTILPFTRGVAGAGDYTICYYTNRIKTTHAHQLALGVIMYSPLQTLFWYDKASDYQGEPEIEFFDQLPTTWDETRILKGEIGKYIATARRKGNEWFVGVITNNDPREIEVSFDFLEKGKKYIATIYQDDEQVKTRTKVALKKIKVTNKSKVDLKLKAFGGAAIWIREQK